jgi:hypothetical protein
MRVKLLGLVLAGLMVVGGTAQAALLSLSGGTANTIPSNFNTGAFPAIPGIVTGTPITEYGPSDTGGLSVSDPASLRFEFLGKDAGYTNTFGVTGLGTLFSTATATVGDATSAAVGSGIVPLFFHTSGGSATAAFDDPNSIPSPLSIAFADLHDGSFLALFNDGGGGDKDFNDMIVRVSVSAVPLPAAAWLLISAVLGLVSFSRIRRRGPQTA